MIFKRCDTYDYYFNIVVNKTIKHVGRSNLHIIWFMISAIVHSKVRLNSRCMMYVWDHYNFFVLWLSSLLDRIKTSKYNPHFPNIAVYFCYHVDTSFHSSAHGTATDWNHLFSVYSLPVMTKRKDHTVNSVVANDDNASPLLLIPNS